MSYDAVVFDMDGVLVGPTDAAALQRAVRRTFEAFGLGGPDDEELAVLYKVANTTEAELERICADRGVDPAEFWRTRERTAAEEQLATVHDGSKALYDDVAALEELDVPTGIVSNNQHETVEGVLAHGGLEEAFDAVRGRPPTLDGIRHKKPDPRYLEAVIDDLGASDPLFVGDSNADLVAADRAGVRSAYLRRPHRDGYELDREPTHRIGSLSEIPDLL